MTPKLRVGILNLMHDKEETQDRYAQVLTNLPFNVELSFFYPKSHYLNRLIPKNVAEISKPLNLDEVHNFDGFIITGFPAEKVPFEEITFIEEVRRLIDKLTQYKIEQLYFCWGAMAALNYLYGIRKSPLPEKLFGVYHTNIIHPNNLLHRIDDGFLAQHARYTEMDKAQIIQDPRLQINAETENGDLFLVSAKEHPEQNFLFAHLEYGKDALLKEYQREIAAHPEINYKKPVNQNLLAIDPSWKIAQQRFFYNWLKQISNKKVNQNILTV